MKAVLAALLVGVAGSAAAQFGKPSAAQQIQLGERAAADLKKKSKVLPDTDQRVIELRKVSIRILAALHDKENWHFSFDVIDSPSINAFALPGGPTFFYTGLLDKLKTEDEIAGVMGHELTHVRLQHWAHQFEASMNRNLLINIGLLILKANNTASGLAGVSDDVLFNLPFSRAEEHQADDGGYDLMTAAGYNPVGMVHAFQMLQVTSKGDSPPPYLSDHPADKSRIEFLQGRIAKDSRSFPAETPMGY